MHTKATDLCFIPGNKKVSTEADLDCVTVYSRDNVQVVSFIFKTGLIAAKGMKVQVMHESVKFDAD